MSLHKSLFLSLTVWITALPLLPAASPAYEKYMRAYGEAEGGKGAAVLPTVEEALAEAEKGGATTLEAFEIARDGAQMAFNFNDDKRALDFIGRALVLLEKVGGEKGMEAEKAADQRLMLISFKRQVLIKTGQLEAAREAHRDCESALLAWSKISGHPLWNPGEPAFAEGVPFRQVAGVLQYLQADAELFSDRAAVDLELIEKFVRACEDYPAPAREAKLRELAEARAKLK